jgi:hypothetical protein
MQLNNLRDNITHLEEDRKVIEDVAILKKKVEGLATTLLSLSRNNPSDDMSGASIRAIQMDTTKYVEQRTFDEHRDKVQREFDTVNAKIEELRQLIEDIIAILKTKASEKDLKDLEGFLLSKIEELKNGCNKKFADKNETAKNLRYLDQQLKYIIDVYIKKMEKGDNWLLAKKPIGGFSCASCEAYIGDLHENNEIIPWNNYPARDNDKLYRVILSNNI